MRAFVTGADGFVGQWLLRRLIEGGHQVTGAVRVARPVLTTLNPELADRVQWKQSDITDGAAMRRLVQAAQPDAVFHLAAQSAVPASLDNPVATIETNVLGTVRLLEAIRHYAKDATVIVVGSSDAYGAVGEAQLPLREDAPLRPQNPYAASKAAAEIVAKQYANTGWCKTIMTRSFNHTGPGQSPSFAIASFAKQFADMKRAGRTGSLHVGDLTPRRDISDVRDVVEAYVGLAQRGVVGQVYNVCSGRDRSMREIVDELARISGANLTMSVESELIRPVENPVLRGDPARIAADIGWKAATPLEKTLADLLEYYSRAAA